MKNKDSGPISVSYVPYQKEFARDFADINYAWLEKFFKVEDQDRKVLEHPEQEIIEPGGQILFALLDGKPIGTVALQVKDEHTFELVKMGVLDRFKGLGIGKGLVDAAIKYAKQTGKEKIVLETNSKLKPAIHLYEKAGFTQVKDDPDTKYIRCDLWMELKFE